MKAPVLIVVVRAGKKQLKRYVFNAQDDLASLNPPIMEQYVLKNAALDARANRDALHVPGTYYS